MNDLIHKDPLPVIVHWDDSHFIVVYKTNQKNGDFFVSEPAERSIRYNKNEFAKRWVKVAVRNRGILMAIERPAGFFQRKDEERLERKKTFENFRGYFRPYKKSFINLFIVTLLVTILQGMLPFIAKAVIGAGIQTKDIDFILIVLVQISRYILVFF